MPSAATLRISVSFKYRKTRNPASPSILDVHSACSPACPRPGSSPAMCRWLVYCGSDPILMSDLIFAPTNSLIHQSFNGGFHPGAPPREISAHQHAFTIASASRPLRPEQHAGRRSPRDTPTQLASHRWRRLSPRALLRSPHLTEYCPTHPVRDKWLFCPEWVLFLPKRIHIHSLAFLSILHMHMHSQSRVSIQQNSSSFKTLRLIQHHSPNIQCLCTFTP